MREAIKEFSSQAPDLVQRAPIAPDITGRGVLPIIDCFWSSPSYRNSASMRGVVLNVGQLPRHAKVTNLKMIDGERFLMCCGFLLVRNVPCIRCHLKQKRS